MRVSITKFKSKCTEYVRTLPNLGHPIEITNRGKVVAVVSMPPRKGEKNPVYGALRNTVTFIAEDFDDPLGDGEWEAGDDDAFA